MSSYITTGKRVSDICLRPLFSGRGDDARAFLETARCQWDVGSDAYVRGPDTLGNPVVGCIRALSPTRTMLTFWVPGGRIGRDPLETTNTLSPRRAATR